MKHLTTRFKEALRVPGASNLYLSRYGSYPLGAIIPSYIGIASQAHPHIPTRPDYWPWVGPERVKPRLIQALPIST